MVDYCTKLVAEIFTIMKNDLFSVLSGRIQYFELFLPPAFFPSFLFFWRGGGGMGLVVTWSLSK